MVIDGNIRRLLIVLTALLFVLPPSKAAAQASFDTLTVADTIYINNCRYSNGEIAVDTLPASIMHGQYSSSIYPNNGIYDAWAVLDLADIMNIFIYSCNILGTPNNYFEIISMGRGDTIAYSHTNCSGVDTVYGGTYMIHLHLEHNPAYHSVFGFSFRWAGASTASTCEHTLRSVTVTNVAGNTAIVNWVSNTDSIYIDYGGGSRLAVGDSYMIMGLDTMTTYNLRINTWVDAAKECCFLERTFTTNTAIPPICIDAADIGSPFATCTVGTAEAPGDSVACVAGRHTVMTDTTGRDVIVGAALRTIPPGHTSSVRLGNSAGGAEGECIIYQMLVDTLQYNILMIKYAAVLQVPNHDPNMQPQFSFSILDGNMQPVDRACGAANFVASENMGWNMANTIYGTVAWKDWTTIGVDLTPYHGRYINIRFITRDCRGGEHFGYAYFTTECYRKGITSPHCGYNISSTLTAPPGFNYYWYTDEATDTVSTSPTVDIVESDTYYHCRLSYIEDSSCWFEMRVWAGRRIPLAMFDYEISTTDCREFNVMFSNHSTISDDGVNPVGTGEPCEEAWWDFGNGQTSTTYCPTTHYDTTGTYLVTLVSSIGDGECQDTLVVPITMPTYLTYQEYYRSCDSLTWWRDNHTYYNDTVGALNIHPGPMACDTAYELHLIVDKSVFTSLGRDTACWSTPYTWHGHAVADSIGEVSLLHLGDTLLTTRRCDSIVGIEVLYFPRVPVGIDAEADCSIKQYRIEGHADAPYIQWHSLPPDPALNGHYSDSVLTLTPQQTTTYTLVADFDVAGLCPSSKSVTLAPVSFPTATLRLKPEYMTLDNMEYDAYDNGPVDQQRSWLVSEYLDGQVVDIATPPPDRQIHGQTSAVVDSVVVALAVSNGFCTDTAVATLPLLRAAIWAPNVFTPLEDFNNRFAISTVGLRATELNIYNREGLLMFSTTDTEQAWDGTHNGRLCEQGAYTWRLDYIAVDLPDRPQKAVGTVLLLR